jgi:hypothetical protein
MPKSKGKKVKKEKMNEGAAIAISVLLVATAFGAAFFVLRWIINYFFPNLL